MEIKYFTTSQKNISQLQQTHTFSTFPFALSWRISECHSSISLFFSLIFFSCSICLWINHFSYNINSLSQFSNVYHSQINKNTQYFHQSKPFKITNSKKHKISQTHTNTNILLNYKHHTNNQNKIISYKISQISPKYNKHSSINQSTYCLLRKRFNYPNHHQNT